MTTLGVVGLGEWGRNLLHTFDELANVPVACHEGDPRTADWLEENFPHVERTTSYEDVLADEEIAAVVLATPIETLASLTEEALLAGKDVFVEKPLARSSAVASKLTELADREDRTLFVGYIFVHHPLFRRLWRELSPIEEVRFEWRKLGGFDPDLLLNLACHPISVATHFLGRPVAIHLTGSKRLTGETDMIVARLEYPERTCSLRVDRVSPRKRYECTLFTADGRCGVATDDACHLFDPETRSFRETSGMVDDPLTAECRQFLAAISQDDPPLTGGELGVEVLTVLEELREQLDR